MKYRRRQGLFRFSTFKEEILRQPDDDGATTSFAAAGALHFSSKNRSKNSARNERGGFWGFLTWNAKSILEDEASHKSNTNNSKKPELVRFSTSRQFTGIQIQHKYESYDYLKKMDNLSLRMGLDRFVSSLNQIGDAFGNDLEVETKIQDIIHETRNMQNQRTTFDDQEKNHDLGIQSSQSQKNQETQIQASQDVRWQMCSYLSCLVYEWQVALATAAQVKQLIRELKTATAELAFAKERCSQLEEENKLLQEGQQKVDRHANDEMIRVQLEALLYEKGRLAHMNLVYARENRFLKERVEFHRMKMQDMVYFYEGIKETLQDSVGEPGAT